MPEDVRLGPPGEVDLQVLPRKARPPLAPALREGGAAQRRLDGCKGGARGCHRDVAERPCVPHGKVGKLRSLFSLTALED